MAMSKSERNRRAESAQIYLPTYLEDATRDNNGRPILYFIVKRVSASGMSRVFSTFVVDRERGSVHVIDHLIADIGIGTRVDDGYRVHGCGMDMRFHVADCIARSLEVENVRDGNGFSIRSV